MRISWSVVYLLLWLYRCAYSVAAQLVIAQFTSLGDSGKYQDGQFGELGDGTNLTASSIVEGPRAAATILADGLGIIFSQFGGLYGSNIGFQTIAFFGIVALLRATPPTMRVAMLGLAMLPSFTIWSSIAGKEALVVYAVGVLSALIIRMYDGTARFSVEAAIAVLLVFLFKNQYMPALLFMILGTVIADRVKQRALLVLLAGVLSMAMLWVFEERLGQEALQIVPHFAGMGSSREAFWTEPQHVLTRAPLGMFLGFFGPTLRETAQGPLQLASFIESTLFLGFLGLILLWRLPRMPVYMALMGLFTLFWILFATYPFGAMNSGSAIRYRTGYQLLVMAVILVTMARPPYDSWRQARRRRRRDAAVTSGGPSLPGPGPGIGSQG